jgi:RNA polymerase sigma-70 factor (ECF subfamily)
MMANGCPTDPETLLQAARAGDLSRLGQLFVGYRNYLKMLARLQIHGELRAKADASDVAQDTLMEAHRAFGDFRGTTEAELLQWLRGILATKLASLARRFYGTRQRDLRLERRLDEQLDRTSQIAGSFATSQSSPSQRAARREQAVILADALAQLPSHYHEVIVLRHFEQLDFPEIAQRMERSPDSVKHLWARALASLNRSLRGDSNGAR